MAAGHRDLYKFKGTDSQERRRDSILKEQERKRDELLDTHRQLVETLTCDAGDSKKRGRPKSELRDLLMLSEWLVRPPEDLEPNWMFIICPEGRRCILCSRQGKTVAVSRRGLEFLKWESPLPGGSAVSWQSTAILDCVYSDVSKAFYVLDVLHWGSLPLVGTEMSFRQFWIKSHLQDEPGAKTSGQYPIVPLKALPCSTHLIQEAMSSFPHFADNKPPVDGVLFYHREAHYTRGSTPLVAWVKPFMLPELMPIVVSNEYLVQRPDSYQGFLAYIAEFNKQYRKKKGCSWWGRSLTAMDVSDAGNDEKIGRDVLAMDESDEEDDEARMKKLTQVEIEG